MNTNKSKNNRYKSRRSNFSKIDISQFDFQTIYEYEQQKSNFQNDFDDEYKEGYSVERYSLDDEDYKDDYLDNVVIEGDDYGYGQKYDLSHQEDETDNIMKIVLDNEKKEFDELGYLKQKYNLEETVTKHNPSANSDKSRMNNPKRMDSKTVTEPNNKRKVSEDKYNLDEYIKKSGISDSVLKFNVNNVNDENYNDSFFEYEGLEEEKLDDKKDVLTRENSLTKKDSNHGTSRRNSSSKGFKFDMGMMSNIRKKKNKFKNDEINKEEYREEKIDRDLVKDFIEDEKDRDLDFLFSKSNESLDKKDTYEGISEYSSTNKDVDNYDSLEKQKENPLVRLGKKAVFSKNISEFKEANIEEDILKDYDKNELPIIELCDVCKEYQEGIEAVANINFKINQGEFVFIVGKSGSGKSTLINLLTRQIRPTSGSVYVNGREIAKLPNKKISKFRRSIGIVFQDFKLLPDRNVFDNVAFAQRVIEKTEEEISINVPDILSMVGLNDRYEAFPNELSGGEKQRVAIARALVNQPSILLADEPTGNLDPKTAWEIMDLLDEINKKGTTVIVVTHNVDIVNIMKKRVIAIEDGEVVSDENEGEYLHED